MSFLRLLSALVLLTLSMLASTTTALAGTYHHLSLNYAGYKNADGWTVHADHQARGYVTAASFGSYLVGLWNIDGGRNALGFQTPEYTSFVYDAPPNTSLTHLYWTNRISGLTGGPWQNVVSDGAGTLRNDLPVGDGQYLRETDVAGSRLTFALDCAGPASCFATANAQYVIDTLDITLNDGFSPSAGAPSGSLAEAPKLTGAATISYPANDAGSGLYRTVIFDGETPISRTVVNANYGHCADLSAISRLFDRQVPCLLSTTASAALDTTKLPDGNHDIKVAVEDAAGNMTTVYGPETKLVANHPPVNSAVPGNANGFATPTVGTVLRFPTGGEWTGPDLNMSYGWLRCDATGGGCEQIPGAMGLVYVPTPDDVGHTLKLAVTATNVAGSVTVYSAKSGVVAAPKSAEAPKDSSPEGPVVSLPGLSTVNNTNSTYNSTTTVNHEHVMLGHIVGEPAGATCPADKATLKFQHISGGRMSLRYGKATTAQLLLTCTNSGKPIAGAKLEIATKTGSAAAVASDVTTDGAGHATIRINKGASRGIAVGYRMFGDDPLARATATLKIYVTGKVSLKASHSRLRNGRAVTLRGTVAGGNVPRRGVTLAVQWKDGRRWRPFAQIKTNRRGGFSYAYRFTRTSRTVRYQLRVQVAKGQVDYPFVAAASKAVKVTVSP